MRSTTQTESSAPPETAEEKSTGLHLQPNPALASLRGPLGLLADRNFRLLWCSSALWQFARWMEIIVTGWLVLELTNSAFHVALVGFFRMVPLLILSLLTGPLADRIERRRLLLLTQTIGLVVTAGMSLLLLAGLLQFWLIALATIFQGLCFALDMPTRRSYILDLVGRPRLLHGIVLDNMCMHSTQTIGPLAGGGLIGTIGVSGCYLLMAGAYLGSVLFLANIHKTANSPLDQAGSVWQRMAEGLGYVRSSQPILGVLAISVAMNAFAFPYLQLLPAFARDVLQVGPLGLGLLAASEGVGSMTGALFIVSRERVRHRGWFFLGGSLVTGLALLTFSTARWYPLSMALLFVSGLGRAGFSAMQSTIILTVASDALRGRAMSTLMLAIGSQPLGILAIGSLATLASVPAAVGVMAGVSALMVASVFVGIPELRRQ